MVLDWTERWRRSVGLATRGPTTSTGSPIMKRAKIHETKSAIFHHYLLLMRVAYCTYCIFISNLKGKLKFKKSVIR